MTTNINDNNMIESIQCKAEKIYIDDLDKAKNALYEAIGTSNEIDMFMWNWFESNISDRGIYFGDATPDELVEALSDEEVFSLDRNLKETFL